MTISRLFYSVETIGTGHKVSPIRGAAILDESWAPYAQSNLTIPLPNDPAVLTALDPRQGARMRVTLSQRFADGFTVAALDRGDETAVSEWTAEGGPAPLSNWTGRYATPYNLFGNRQSNTRRMDLGIRDRVINYKDGTVDITLASDEALLQDQRNLDTLPRVPATESVYGAVALALASIGAAASIEAADVPFEPGSVTWEPGMTAWDYVRPLVDAAGLRLWCDENRQWHLAQPNLNVGDLLAFTPSTLKDVSDTVSRDNEWFDAVHVTYRWTDSSGTERVAYDVASLGNPTKVHSVEYNRPYPRPGAAQSILNRAKGRGRVETLTAVTNPSASPRQPLRVNLPDTITQAGYVTRVEWNMDSDEMRIGTRDLADSGPNAWLLVPDGIGWDDVPDGTSWTDYSTAELTENES